MIFLHSVIMDDNAPHEISRILFQVQFHADVFEDLNNVGEQLRGFEDIPFPLVSCDITAGIGLFLDDENPVRWMVLLP